VLRDDLKPCYDAANLFTVCDRRNQLEKPSRRSFTQSLLGGIGTFSLAQSLLKADLLAAPLKRAISPWVTELEAMCKGLKDGKVKQTEWQQKAEELFQRVELRDLLKATNFDRIARKIKFLEEREAIWEISRIDGSKISLTCLTMFEALKRGRAIVPHGHRNMASFHMVLSGQLHTRCYDRVESDAQTITIKPTIDEVFTAGKLATMSDEKDNVHWFKAVSETVYAFNVGVYSINPNMDLIGREYIDPDRGEKLSGGLIRAGRISTTREAYTLYGKS
jgi:hypothetical protein